MGAARLLFVALFVAAAISPALSRTFLSHTSEQESQTSSLQLCPDSPHEVEKLGDFGLSEYARRPIGKQLHLRLGRHESAAQQQNHTHQPQDLSGTAGRLADIYAAPVVLPSLALQNAVSNLGDTRRLERFLYKLLSSEAVTVVALGGSVTAGHGVENVQLNWMARTFAWINATFPNREHRLLNHAIPGVSSAYVGYCVESLVPSDTDLVFMEFTWNDGALEPGHSEMNTPARRGLEKMLRKILTSGRSAVINMHFHPILAYAHLWEGAEANMEILFKHYELPSLSSRNGLRALFTEQPWMQGKVWPGDNIHPSCVGHRYLADMMVGFLQDMAAHVVLAGHDQLPHSAVLQETLLPAAMLPQGGDDRHDNCITDEGFRDLATLEQGNWTWVNEARRPGPPKLGYVSWQPGDVMTLKVPLDAVLPALEQDRRMLVAVGFLVSYEHMGKVSVGCSGGCSCPAKEFNCHLPSSQRFSLTYWKGLTVTLEEGSQACELRVTNANQTDSGEHKVKLTSLLVSLDTEGFIHNGNGDVL